MIEPRELRKGNILQDQNGNYLKVCNISEKGYGAVVIDRSKYPLPEGWKAQPIPLTEEILLKCGFNWSNQLESFEYKYGVESGFKWLAKYSDINGGYKFWSNIHNCMLTSKEFRYLHQLQNLYYSLTGKELEIEL